MKEETFLSKRKIEKKQDKQHQILRYVWQGTISKDLPEIPKETLEQATKKISKASAELGIILLNVHANFRHKYDTYWRYWDNVSLNDKRFQYLIENYDITNLWSGEHATLLEFFFGEEIAAYVKTAWSMFPQLMFQDGYSRRSFRAPNLPKYTALNQLNFIITLNGNILHDLTLEERIIHAHQLGNYRQKISYVLAAAINEGQEKIQQLLLDIVYNRHPEGKVTRSIIKGLLLSNNTEAWVAVEKLLLSAQRQEGLRQTILECLDETSIGAMKHLMKVLIEHKLSRFSSVVRAIDVWAGFGWESEREPTVRRFLELGYKYLTQPALIKKGVLEKDNAEVYMALWAQGVYDIEKCFPLLEKLYDKGTIEKRTLALYFVREANIAAQKLSFAWKAVKDDSLQVFYWAVLLLDHSALSLIEESNRSTLFEIVERRLLEVPKKGKSFQGKIFAWLTFQLLPEQLYGLLIRLTRKEKEAELVRILPHFKSMTVHQREEITKKIIGDYFGNWEKWEKKETAKKLNLFQRDFAFSILKDRAEMVRTTGLWALYYAELADEEVKVFEDLLRSKNAAQRKSVIRLLLSKDLAQVQKSIDRLLFAKAQEQRLAGLDMLNSRFTDADNSWVKKAAHKFSERKTISSKEQILLDNLLQKTTAIQSYTWENGFHIYDPNNTTAVSPPQLPTSGEYVEKTKDNQMGISKSAAVINEKIAELEQLFLKHKDYEYEVENWDNTKSMVLLGNRFTRMKNYNNEAFKKLSKEDIFNNFPLGAVWRKWWEESGLTPTDLFLINFGKELEAPKGQYTKGFPVTTQLLKEAVFLPTIPIIGQASRWNQPLSAILSNLQLIFPYSKKVHFMEGFVRSIFASIPTEELTKVYEEKYSETSTYYYIWKSASIIDAIFSSYKKQVNTEDAKTFELFWQLDNWHIHHTPHGKKRLPNLKHTCKAYEKQLITKDELMHRLMESGAIDTLTKKIRNKQDKKIFNFLETFPFLEEMVDTCRNRILEIELKRGDRSTLVTQLAQNINTLSGIPNFINTLNGLGKDNLHRGYIYSWSGAAYTKKEILSTLLKRCTPEISETQQQFNQAVKAAGITEKRLVETAMYAQQWIPFISNYLGWKGLQSAIWWLHAHTNSHHNAETETHIGRFSKIDISDFKEGAVDINWFKEAYKTVGKTKWEMIHNAAKYVSSGNGHNRAQLYADVILGKTKIRAIEKKVKEKRNQDYLRVYGLVPLSKKTPQKDKLNRYNYLQKFKKESKKFGSQRQASEGTAVRIAMENLARTAGFSDPIRLTWAMETAQASSIMENKQQLVFGETTIELVVDENGKSSIICTKAGKAIKAIPAKLRKDKGVIQLKEFHKIFKNQYSRTRKSLEEAMVNGDVFQVEEILNLTKHPVVAPMLLTLVLKSGDSLGFLRDGKLESVNGQQQDLGETLTLAHCTDLYKNGDWTAYQTYCFDKKIKQPFKQIFRELYTPTEDELKEVAISRRYAGHQVQPKKTIALLKTCGWTVDYEEGLQKVFHKQGMVARMYAMADWFSPAEVESPTLETVQFFDKKTWKKVPFESLDARVFSEVMRDIDLVVSVAHVGDVDPEASHSTVEMRAVIVQETARLFKLDNVQVKGHHVHIKGKMGEYTIHLGSAVVHQAPAIYLSILPVHSQHRGRLFLPFMDEDPKSAELMSKMLLLAKDNEIQDPTILRQIKVLSPS